MVKVHLWSGLRRFTDGDLVVPVEAGTIAQMLRALIETHPQLAPVIEAGVSVVVDGEVLTDNHNRPVGPQNEIYLMQRLTGG